MNAKYQMVVYGNGTAGLWFLRRYAELTKLLPDSSSFRALWIRTPDATLPLLLPAGIAQAFHLPEGDETIEFVTPERVFSWNSAKLAELGFSESVPLYPSRAEWKRITVALRHHPEILGYAAGLWKWLGRTTEPSPERMIWAALQARSYRYCDPVGLLPDNLDVLSTDELGPFQSSEWLKTKTWRLVSESQTIETENLIVSGPADHFATLRLNEAYLPKAPSTARPGLFPVELNVKTRPTFLKPFSLLFDTEEIPDPHGEIWPLTVASREKDTVVSVWCESEDQITEAKKRLAEILPRDYSDAQVRVVPEAAIFRTTSVQLSSETRHPALFHLEPNLLAQYPYPLGAWLGAEARLRHTLGRKRLRQIESQNPLLDKRP